MATINLGKVVPQKGVDYFTNADKTEIQGMVETQIAPTLAEKELSSNKVTSIGDSSTDTEYPSAKATYDLLQAKDALIAELEEQNEIILNQIPTSTATGETINVNDSSNLPLKSFELQGNATQNDTPTPTAPQAIHVVTGDNTIKIQGKNLFDGTLVAGRIISDGSITGTSSSNNKHSNKIEIMPSTDYTLSFKIAVPNNSFYLAWYDSTSQLISTVATKNGTVFHLTSPNNAKYVAISIYNNEGQETLLEVGSTATTYEPYQGQSVTLPLGDIELAGIGDYKDRIYKDNGKWYLYKATGKGTQDSTNYDSFGTSYTNLNVLVMTKITSDVKNGNVTRAIGWLSNKFTYSTRPNGYDDANLINCIYDSANNKYYIGLPKTITTAEQAVESIGSYDLYYVRKTPTITEITDTALINALEQVEAMTTYKTTTNAFTLTASDNATPTLQVEYRQDIETLINNLDARLSLLE